MTGEWCTASQQDRSWTVETWIGQRTSCPDCGKSIRVFTGGCIVPWGKASKHKAPAGVTPSPFGWSGGKAT